MTKAPLKPGLPISLPAEIPTTWTPEQATAVFELLTEIRDRIWLQYNVQIQTELQNQLGCDDQQKSTAQNLTRVIFGTEYPQF